MAKLPTPKPKSKKPSKMDAQTVQRKSTINRKRSVSATDIREATTANQMDAVQRRINAMPDGNIKNAMQKMLDAQRKKFEAKQSADVDKAGRKSAQSARDRQEFKGYTPKNPFEGMKKGGMVKRKNYKDGGYANCGASVKATQKSSKMMYGGMAKKKK